MTRPYRSLFVRRLLVGSTIAWVVVALIVGTGQAAPPAVHGSLQSSCQGRWYRIQQGDSWSNLSQRTGVSVVALKAANPSLAQQPQGWLLVGQQLCLLSGSLGPLVGPTNTPSPDDGDSIWVTVRRGDSWAVLAARTGVSVAELQAANAQAMRPNQVLRPGDRIRVPATPEMTRKIPCPDTLEEFPLSAALTLTEFNGIPAVLRSYLERCGALTADWGTVHTASLRGGSAPEVVVVAAGPKTGAANPLGLLSVLGPGDLGWEVLYEAGVAADVDVLATEDVNADGHPDVAWSDTTCGARACFTTVHIISWVDGSFQDWIEGSTTMASADVQLDDVLPEGSGQELVMTGGVVGTIPAGPQRVVTNTWASPAGAPYELVRQEAAPSDCLYHRVQDGDLAMATGAQDGYAAAIAAYRSAIDDPRWVACWIRENELDELRAYALYRLAVAHAYAGQVDAAGQVVADLAQRYPADSYANLAELWWIAYRTTRDAFAACAVAHTVADRRPDTWQRLADYGFANPTFALEMICPSP